MSAASRAAALRTPCRRNLNTIRSNRTWALYLDSVVGEADEVEEVDLAPRVVPQAPPRLPPPLLLKTCLRKWLPPALPQPPLLLPTLHRLLRRHRRPSNVRRSSLLAPIPTAASWWRTT